MGDKSIIIFTTFKWIMIHNSCQNCEDNQRNQSSFKQWQ